jgi:hypothetical protein
VLLGSLVFCATATASWQRPVVLATVPWGEAVEQPLIAREDRGEAVAAWTQGYYEHQALRVATQGAGGSWGPPRSLAPVAKSNEVPALAMDSRGVGMIVWTHWIHTGSREEQYIELASHSRGRWSAPVRIARGEARATLALDAAGDADVLTSGYASAVGARPNRDQLLLSLRSPSGRLHGPLSLPVPFDDSGEPAPVLALDGSGRATVAWVDASGSTERVAVLELDRDGRIVRPVQLMSRARPWSRGCSVGAIRLRVNRRGDAIVAWEQQAPESSRVVCGSAEVAVRRAGRPFGRPRALAGPSGDGHFPGVAIDGNGTATVLYEADVGGGRTEVDELRHAAGGDWTSPLKVSPPAATTAGGPVLALGARGQLVALWEEFLPAGVTEGQYVAVEASSSRDGRTWTAPTQLSPAGMDCREPELAMAAGGSATAIWRNEGEHRLDAHGETINEPTRVEVADYSS